MLTNCCFPSSLLEQPLCLGDNSITITELLGLLSHESYWLQAMEAETRYKYAGLPHQHSRPRETKVNSLVLTTPKNSF